MGIVTTSEPCVKIVTQNPHQTSKTLTETKVVVAVKAEVYSRIVGYYRPVQDWNRGKREEFSQRETMSPSQVVDACRDPDALGDRMIS